MASVKEKQASVSPQSRKRDIPIKKLHVSNLSGSCVKRELEKLFAQYGEIDCSYLRRNFAASTWAFITFKNAQDAAKALEAAKRKEIKYNGRCLMVNSADTRHQPDSVENQKKVALLAARKAKTKKKTERPVVVDEPTGPALINHLNDDCLARIFMHLPMSQRVDLECVCKRWRLVCQQAWHDVKQLDFSQQDDATTDLFKLPHNCRTNKFIGRILMRCGRYLSQLKLGEPCRHDILPIVASHCQNLVKLELELTKYNMKSCAKLFPQMKKLKYVEVKNIAQDFSGECLDGLPQDTLAEIHLWAKTSEDHLSGYKYLPKKAHSTFENLQNLSSITFNGFSLKSNMMKAISQKTSLTFLSLANCAVKKGLPLLTQLVNLEHLNLTRGTEVDDKLLINLSNSCKNLKYLNLSQCISVSDRGVVELSKLPHLEELLLNDVFEVSDEALNKMHSLRKLECENCDCVNDPGIVTLLRYAPNLEYINLANSGVSELVLVEATEITKRRTNNLKLKITVSTSVRDDWDDTEEYSPLLIVEDKEDDMFDDYNNTDYEDDDDYYYYDRDDDDELDYDDDFDLFNPYDDYDDDDYGLYNVMMLL